MHSTKRILVEVGLCVAEGVNWFPNTPPSQAASSSLKAAQIVQQNMQAIKLKALEGEHALWIRHSESKIISWAANTYVWELEDFKCFALSVVDDYLSKEREQELEQVWALVFMCRLLIWLFVGLLKHQVDDFLSCQRRGSRSWSRCGR